MSKLLEQTRDKIRLKHYSFRTEQAYLHWIKAYILFHQKRHPLEMGKSEVSQFLTHLAVNRKWRPPPKIRLLVFWVQGSDRVLSDEY